MTADRYINAVTAACPEMFAPRSCLYVGARQRHGLALIPELRLAGYQITILEVWPPNVDQLESELLEGERIIQGDVRNFDPPTYYDLVVWWHGPEHVKPAELDPVVRKMPKWGTRVVLGMPWGHQVQGKKGGNPHEQHVWDCEPGWFAERGYDVKTVGTKNVVGGQIVAQRKMSAPPSTTRWSIVAKLRSALMSFSARLYG